MTLVKNKNIYYPKLSYKLTGLFFKVHNELGRSMSERQYCDAFEKHLKENNVEYQREKEINKIFSNVNSRGNIPDFIIDQKIIVDFKAKRLITKEDFYQMMRYLEVANLPLGIIVNFRSHYLSPKRVINPKFHSSNSGNYS
ncbi:hypothetical protein BMS3Abin15_00849 [bacterium BMS3Abin15]|nr:hypothetical protein BMS3Abin15_00849 [bacterium BMS3Abin15]HDZ85832.1 GxxExxY protein [Candidatus Moranbacteria bacterium]